MGKKCTAKKTGFYLYISIIVIANAKNNFPGIFREHFIFWVERDRFEWFKVEFEWIIIISPTELSYSEDMNLRKLLSFGLPFATKTTTTECFIVLKIAHKTPKKKEEIFCNGNFRIDYMLMRVSFCAYTGSGHGLTHLTHLSSISVSWWDFQKKTTKKKKLYLVDSFAYMQHLLVLLMLFHFNSNILFNVVRTKKETCKARNTHIHTRKYTNILPISLSRQIA